MRYIYKIPKHAKIIPEVSTYLQSSAGLHTFPLTVSPAE
jgi:hypothetical protein